MLTKLLVAYHLNRRFYHWDKATLKKHQLGRISKVLEYAKKHSPYYNSIMSGQDEYDLPSIPKMDKKIMMEHWLRILIQVMT